MLCTNPIHRPDPVRVEPATLHEPFGCVEDVLLSLFEGRGVMVDQLLDYRASTDQNLTY